MSDTIPTRVARGVALLDEKLPGWHLRIDVARLNLCSACNCILGQEFATHEDVDGPAWTGFDVGVREVLNGDVHQASEYGFDADGFSLEGEGRDFVALTAEWRRVILARRGGA